MEPPKGFAGDAQAVAVPSDLSMLQILLSRSPKKRASRMDQQKRINERLPLGRGIANDLGIGNNRGGLWKVIVPRGTEDNGNYLEVSTSSLLNRNPAIRSVGQNPKKKKEKNP